jgi:hypothetical protein
MNIKNNFFKLTTIGLLTITGILTTKCTYQQQDNLTKKSKIEIVGRTGTTTRFKDIYDKNYTLVERIVDDSTAEVEESDQGNSSRTVLVIVLLGLFVGGTVVQFLRLVRTIKREAGGQSRN